MSRCKLMLLAGLGASLLAPAAWAQDAGPAPTPPTSAETEVVPVDDLGLEEAAAAPDAQTPTSAPARAAGAMDPAPADPSLRPVLAQFGGREGLVALMDVFMAELLADPRTRPFFAEADQAGIKRHLVEQFCVILGGDCTYSGRDMKSAHEGMGVSREAFNALVEDLQVAMDKRGIPFRAQNRLLARLAPLHRDIEGPAAP